VAWLCDACNLSLTEHAIQWWDRLASVHLHDCRPPAALFALPAIRPDAETSTTKPLHLSNGGGDDRYITVSKVPGTVTVEQLAAICGVNANTARDIASGRQNGQGIGRKHDGTWLIEHSNALAYLAKRWGMQ
jgi:hypothetical protein